MRVYIAGALSSRENTERNPSKVVTDYIQNVSRMCQVASQVRRLGHYPYVPGLDFLLGVIAGDWEEDDYREVGMSFLEVCDAVLVISQSWGVSKEIERANELGIPVYYNLEEL
jgi:hypothetical protein